MTELTVRIFEVYIYDEEVEVTKFEELPEEWTCPLCGVGKDMFEKIEE